MLEMLFISFIRSMLIVLLGATINYMINGADDKLEYVLNSTLIAFLSATIVFVSIALIFFM
mgnify:CR=1 FL=1